MYNDVDEAELLVEDSFIPILPENETDQLKEIYKEFVTSYIKNKDTMDVEDWLSMELQDRLPEYSKSDIEEIKTQIVVSLRTNEEKKQSLVQAIENGRSKESWFAAETKKATANMSVAESTRYLNDLDTALNSANESLVNVITTQSGSISQNPHLDGFIAEQYHAQTFNLNAEASGSQYRAKVLQPDGQGYAKNSVDIVIVDGNGKVVRRYQSKYCKDVDGTLKAFEKGDYRGQRKLVADGQEIEIPKSTNVIEAPDGTRSTALSKQKAKELQNEAQNGQWNELNWNEYKAKDLAIGVGKQAGYAALQGAAIGIGFNVAQKVWNGEEIEGSELVESAIVSGADFGIKAAAAGALKVGVEKGIVSAIPKGTPAGTIANIAYVAVENAKVLGKIATGELTVKEGLEKMEQTTVSTVVGIAASAKGAAIGATIGTVFGPVGTVVGGFVGGTIGYMAGSKVGETVVKGVQKVREVTKTVVTEVAHSVCKGVERAGSAVKSFCSGVASLFGW